MDGCDAGGSVTRWIDPLKAGDFDAAQALWNRYFDGLVRLARARLRDAPRAVADEEDVALSAIHCLCRGAAAGRFPQLADRDNLWRLLATIAAQKAVDLQRRETREKRGGGAMSHGEVALTAGDFEANVAANVGGREPSPEFAAQLDEEYRRQLDRLEDEGLRQIAVWKMEGYENEEIARRLGCGVRTVERKLGVIRSIWHADRRD